MLKGRIRQKGLVLIGFLAIIGSLFHALLHPGYGEMAYASESRSVTLQSQRGGISARAREVKATRSKRQEDYRLQRGDRVNVTIYPEDEYVRGGEILVTEEGDIRIHTLGKVSVADMTIVEAEKAVTEALRDYFVEPAVVIELLESKEMVVVILGEVRRPGTYPFPTGSNRFTLMEAIALAGGFSELANIKKITVTRKDESGKADQKRANAEKILQGKDPDVALMPNDIIHVSESLF